MTDEWKTREGVTGDIREVVDTLDSTVVATDGRVGVVDWTGFGPVVAEKRCEGLSSKARRGEIHPEVPTGTQDGVLAAVSSKERFLFRRVASRGPETSGTALDVGARHRAADRRTGRFAGDVVRTVMRTGLFLRVGCAALLFTGATGVASAFDPNGSSGEGDVPANVQALAPLPTPNRVGTGPALAPAPAALSVPPGISSKLLPGPVVTPTEDLSADEEFRAGTRLYYAGDRKAALEQLRRAAERGHPIAQWKLGKMYETGDGVPVNDAKAMEFYREVIDNHADDARGTPQAAFVASAFVALGSYYLKGVEKAAIRPNVDRARDLYTYAASIFGDTEAQYRLGRLYLEASGEERDPRQAARWLTVAAKKGHCGAQAMLGQLLFSGDDGLPRRPVQGLMWLTIARANANGAGDDWIREVQEQVFSVANENERRRGVADAQDWIARSGNP